MRRHADPRWIVAALLVVALVLRIGLVAATDPPLGGDAVDYDRHAVSLAQDGRYPDSGLIPSRGPTAFRPPVYPVVLGAAYWVTGTADSEARIRVGRILGALLGLIAVVLVGAVARALYDPRTGLVALGLAAVYIPFVAVADALLAETLFTVLVLAAVLVALKSRAADRTAWRTVVAVGVLAALAALTRTNGLLLLPVLAAVLWRPPRRTWRTAVPAVGVLLVGLVLVATWSVRNSVAFGAPTALTTQIGFTLAGTYNDVSRTDERLPAAWSPAPVPPYASTLQRTDLDEREANGELVAIARRYIRDRPTYLAEVGFWNSVRLLGLQGTLPDVQGAAEVMIGPRTAKAVTYSVYPLLLLVLAGIALGALRHVPRWTWLLPVLLWLSLVLVSGGHSRYRIVIDGFLLVIAAYAIVTLATRVHGRRREPLGH